MVSRPNINSLNFRIIIIETIIQCDKNVFPTVYKLLKYLKTLPGTTASGEQLFFTLKRLNTY